MKKTSKKWYIVFCRDKKLKKHIYRVLGKVELNRTIKKLKSYGYHEIIFHEDFL